MINTRLILAKIITQGKSEEAIQNHGNGYKTVCTSSVLRYFRVYRSDFRYSQTSDDVVKILRRKGFTVRSRFSSIKRGSTVGSVRKQLKKRTEEGLGYLIQVEGHMLLLDINGQTIVDTDERLRDKRKIKAIYLAQRG